MQSKAISNIKKFTRCIMQICFITLFFYVFYCLSLTVMC